jgi:hypothetical protein
VVCQGFQEFETFVGHRTWHPGIAVVVTHGNGIGLFEQVAVMPLMQGRAPGNSNEARGLRSPAGQDLTFRTALLEALERDDIGHTPLLPGRHSLSFYSSPVRRFRLS